jgi:sulfite reductase alpha subunit-like flavoprotein
LIKNGYVWLLTAFSRDQVRKIYVQKILREGNGGNLIADHILQRGGAIYIAGGPRMARGVKEEIVEVLSEQLGGEKEANRLLNKLQRAGRFSVEAWS